MSTYSNIISKFSRKTILVLGDIILDRYVSGSVSRISPEAPVPIVKEEESFFTPGGAANVAQNLQALGAKVILVGKTGNDFEGSMLKRLLKKSHIAPSGIFVDKKVPTVTKTRILAQHQQVVRIDKEKINVSTEKATSQKIFNFIGKHIDDCDAVIISDYGKGLVTPELVNYVCALALEKKKIITVDPKVEHFGYYHHVTAITPNLREAENAIHNIKITSRSASKLGINTAKLSTDKDINLAGTELLKYLSLDSLLLTLGERGMRLFEKGKKPTSIKTKAQEVYDVTGAGDAVISIFTLGLACKSSKRQAANLANIAGGIVVGKMGAVAVSKDELLDAIKKA